MSEQKQQHALRSADLADGIEEDDPHGKFATAVLKVFGKDVGR